MAKVNITAGTASAYGAGELQLQNKSPMDGTLRIVTDNANTASPLKLSTSLVQSTSTIKITTSDVAYIDAEDNSGNNRFTVSRASASQLVTVDFASVPSSLTTPVGAIRTATDGVNLANVMTFLENGKIGIGTDTPTCVLNLKSNTNDGTIAFSINNSARKVLDITDRAVITANAQNSSVNQIYSLGFFSAFDAGCLTLNAESNANGIFLAGKSGISNYINNNLGIGTETPTARLQVKGSGSTSATTSLLVQNSAGTEAVKVLDNLQIRANFTNALTSAATPVITLSSAQTGFFSPNQNQIGVSCFGNDTLLFNIGNPLHNAALSMGRITNPGNTAAFGWCSDGSLELTGNAQSVFVNPTNNKSLIVGGSTENTTAILQADSTTKGFLPPRMTTAQKNAIATPAAGLMVYDTTLAKLCVYTTAWETITSV